MILIRSKTPNWLLFMRWMLASTLALVLGISLADLLTCTVGQIPIFNPDRLFAPLALMSVGLMLGLTQSHLGGPVLPASGRWVTATLAGCALALPPLVVNLLPGLRIPPILADALLFAYLGSMIGLAQWILLRKKYAAAGWWIPANALGFLSFLVLSEYPAGSMKELLYVAALLGMFLAAPSGALLLWFTHWPRAAAK
jgi:hypothetical protein